LNSIIFPVVGTPAFNDPDAKANVLNAPFESVMRIRPRLSSGEASVV
jgi:hypothetical protein